MNIDRLRSSKPNGQFNNPMGNSTTQYSSRDRIPTNPPTHPGMWSDDKPTNSHQLFLGPLTTCPTRQPSHPQTHQSSKLPVPDDNHIHREPEGCIAPYGPHVSRDGSDAPDSKPSSTNTRTGWSGWVMTGVVLCFIPCGSRGARPARAAGVRLNYESITSPHATPKSSFRGHPVTFHTT